MDVKRQMVNITSSGITNKLVTTEIAKEKSRRSYAVVVG